MKTIKVQYEPSEHKLDITVHKTKYRIVTTKIIYFGQ